MSLRSVIERFATGRYVVNRRYAPVLVDGRVTNVPPDTFEIVASIQPLSGREAQALAEGLSANDTRTVYTTSELRTTSGGALPDQIKHDGALWDVYNVSKWEGRKPSGSPHYVALIVRRNDD